MKKLLLVLCCTALILGACDKDDKTVEYTVKFDADGGVPAPSDQKVKEAETVTEPPAITKTGHTFDGWYKDAEKWNFATAKVIANMTLKAKWNVSPKSTLRYETVPYGAGSSSKSLVKSGVTDNLVFYDYNKNRNYYFFVLGYVKSTPLAYRPAVYYNGQTSITVSYSSSNVTEQTISSSVTEAFENSVTKSQSTTWGNEVGVMAGIEATAKVPLIGESKVKFEASYKHTWGGSDGTDIQNSRSFSNTYETSSSKASEIRDEISVTIGHNAEPAGMYRFSLFTTTDVYFIMVTNRAKDTLIDAFTAYCARPTQYWELDYDPERGGSFKKTAQGALLQIPDLTLSQLPDIAECEHQWGAWVVTTAPTGSSNGVETRTCEICHRTETRTIPGGTGLFDLSTGSWITGSGNAYLGANNILTVNNGANFAITGSVSNGRRIVVNGTATITLDNVSITGLGENLCPIELGTNANLTLILEGKNTLTAGTYRAGIQTTGATLTINGSGELDVRGGAGGAGIGGSRDSRNGADGVLNIKNVEKGYDGGAGGTITIHGGTVRATGGSGGAGIGGGSGSNGGRARDKHDTVGDYGENGASGGTGGAGSIITINGGSVSAMGDGGGVDIGGGTGGMGGMGGNSNLDQAWVGGITANASVGGNGGIGGAGGKITITSGTLTTSGINKLANGGAGGKGGNGGYVFNPYGGIGGSGGSGGSGGAGGNITIIGGTVTTSAINIANGGAGGSGGGHGTGPKGNGNPGANGSAGANGTVSDKK